MRRILFIVEGCCGQFDQFAAIWSYEETIVGLEITGNLAKRDQFVGGIEEEEFAQLRMLDVAISEGSVSAVRQLDGSYHMVESVVRRHLARDGAPFSV